MLMLLIVAGAAELPAIVEVIQAWFTRTLPVGIALSAAGCGSISAQTSRQAACFSYS